MKPCRNLIIGIALLLAGVAGLMTTAGSYNFMRNMMGAQLLQGIEPEELPEPQSSGARLLAQYCTQCHNLPGPGMHSAPVWQSVVERMDQRMRMMSGRNIMGMMHDIKAPADRELETLIAYLQKYAQKPIDKSQYKDLNSLAGRSFEAVCSQCHALPDPGQHTVDEWPAVVRRMMQNMTLMGKSVPDAEVAGMIVGFLQKHAR